MPAPKATNVGKATMESVGPKIQENVAPPLNTVDTAQTTAYAYDPDDIVVHQAEEIQVYEPKDRIPAGEIVYVRNNTHGIVRWTDGYKSDGSFNLKLDPAGDAGSIVSIEQFGVLRNPGFQRWWKQGKLTVTNDPRINPVEVDKKQVEVERLQQFALEGTLERTGSGSLPLPKTVDMSFLDDEYHDAHKGRPRPQRG